MPALASEVLHRAQTQLLDALGVRWPLSELAMWLNDAQREAVVLKPSCSATVRELALVAGTRQTLPADVVQWLSPVRNAGGRAVRAVSMHALDHQDPDWHTRPAAATVKQTAFDRDEPLAFYVIPPNDGTGRLVARVSVTPAPVAPTADAEVLSSYAVPLALAEVYANALLDYVLYRAYGKDASHAANAQRSGAHYQAFAAALGIKATQEAAR